MGLHQKNGEVEVGDTYTHTHTHGMSQLVSEVVALTGKVSEVLRRLGGDLCDAAEMLCRNGRRHGGWMWEHVSDIVVCR